MRYLLMLGFFKDHINWEGKKFPPKEGENPVLLAGARHYLVDLGWKWLLENKGVDRQVWNANRAPMPLHVHAVFANVL
jgi:hypothetical protein